MKREAILILDDGSEFRGWSFGAERNAVGEVVFNTGMTGYPESLTDPSYAGQILVLTYPLVGNYGVPSGGLTPTLSPMGEGNREREGAAMLPEFMESERIHVRALVVADYSEEYCHWNAAESLSEWMKREGIPGITGVDTRRLTQLLRKQGVMRGRLCLSPATTQSREEDIAGGENDASEDYGKVNWVKKVSNEDVIRYNIGAGKRVVVVDCGVKANIIRCLTRRGVEVVRVPWDYNFNELDFDGLFLSNGPGDPARCEKTVEHIRKFLEGELQKTAGKAGENSGETDSKPAGIIGGRTRPLMGICLGHQLLALAVGARTYKLKYGHRSQNQPVRLAGTPQCFVTSQNHGYAVDASTLPEDWEPLFENMNDGSNEGIRHKTKPWFSVQFHPEACSGPVDTEWMFDEFVESLSPGDLGGKTAEHSHGEDGETAEHSLGGDGKTAEHSHKAALFSGRGDGQEAASVLILGSGALKIGQAGEFDYSGAQALKALREEGIRSILINPNIATVQTSKDVADTVYFQAVTPEFVERVIAKERPDGILLSFGGQTALNCGVELYRKGVLEKYGVTVLGTPIQAIIDTEDRDRFVKRLDEIGVKTIRSRACMTKEEVRQAAQELGFPVILRAAYALGGLGSGFCENEEELERQSEEAFSFSPQVLVEKSLRGWKEIEYEVVRDRHDNCITVCNMENFDPLGIHTGESIVVAPSQTLTNSEYHKLRDLAIKIIRHIGIVGECNVQYALDPQSEDYRVIEVNARLSRSSALASKATGYPLAFVAAKLGLGYGLHELKNAVTKSTSAFFEPALDYVVVKIPRWDLTKFHGVTRELGSSMKSVGEVMAIGRTFEEALQKGLRMIGQGMHGFVENHEIKIKDVRKSLHEPTDMRIFVLAKALSMGYSVKEIHEKTMIDSWFLQKLNHIMVIDQRLHEFRQLAELVDVMDPLELIEYLETPEFTALLREAKIYGFSDFQIARAIGLDCNMTTENAALTIRQWRKELGVVPEVNQIDTLAAEYPAETNYLYLTYL